MHIFMLVDRRVFSRFVLIVVCQFVATKRFAWWQTYGLWMNHLCTLVVITNTDGTLAAKAVGPESTKLNVGLWDLGVGNEEPSTKDWLGKDVENSVGDDLLVNVHVAGAVGDTPDNWVDGPDDKSETTNGSEKVTDLATLGEGSTTSVKGEHPDDNEVGDAGNGVPAPLLRSTLAAKGGKETGKDHDDIGNKSEEDVTTAKTSEEAEIEKEERSGKGPVDISCPVNLTVDVLGRVWNVLVGLLDNDVVVADTVSSGLEKLVRTACK